VKDHKGITSTYSACVKFAPAPTQV